jgi:ribosomal protein S18 acetylase RimI-like enzyme
MHQVDVRLATYADAMVVTDLVNAAYRPQPGAGGWTHETGLVAGQRIQVEQAEKKIQQSNVLVGIHGTEIVACVQIQCKGKEAYIGMLAVRPHHQGTGVGKHMLDRAESLAVAQGVDEYRMLVLSARRELIDFYRRRGYSESGAPMAYPRDAGVGVPMVEELGVIMLRKFSNTALQPTSGREAAFPG